MTLTEHEVRALIQALLDGSAPRAVHEAMIARFLRWANEAKTTAELVDLAIAGKVEATWDANTQGWAFRRAGE